MVAAFIACRTSAVEEDARCKVGGIACEVPACVAACLRRICSRAEEPNPVVDMTICIVALLILSKASLHDSAGGQLSIISVNTDVAASTVKSTSSKL